MPGYCVCFAKVTPLFLGLRSMADAQVPCCQSFVAATNPLWQNILVVVTIVIIQLESRNAQGDKKSIYSRLVGVVSRRGRIPAG